MTRSTEDFLAPVVRFERLRMRDSTSDAHKCFLAVAHTVRHLGRAAQLGQHRALIEALDRTLSHKTLEAIASASVWDMELCAAFSVYFTTLEQAYAWPRKDTVCTPKNLHDHKVVIQMLYHEELSQILLQTILKGGFDTTTCCQVACLALREAELLLKAAADARLAQTPLPDAAQDKVNLLYRTCTQDWFLQGDYHDPESHRQFGRLHETIRTSGTQRSVQALFQRSATAMLQRLPGMLSRLAAASDDVAHVFEQLQVDVSRARGELFAMVIDEVVWGQTFATYSKPVGLSTIGAGGADCPMFRMLDAVCGKAGACDGDALLAELDMRTRHFPPTIRGLVHRVAAAPSVRAHIARGRAAPRLARAFAVFQQLLHDLYEMHRKKALRIVLALRAGQLYTSSGTQNAKAPEWHISNTLRKAMVVRFGSDPATRRIPAMASPVRRHMLAGREVGSAVLRLDFDAPIALAAGDTMAVTVHHADSGDQTRTYSITKTCPLPGFDVETDDDLHVTKSVEICCRSAGLVSSFLCQQEKSFTVSVALAPSPHFRIKTNKSSHDNTYFIAQNGGAGIFLGWLSRREVLVGTYTLVIGAQNLHHFIHTQELFAAMDKFHGQLHVILCLTKPDTQDLELLAGKHCRVYHGRVPAVLEDLCLRQGLPTYVCGSSEFALGVATMLNRPPKNQAARTRGRMAAINTSSMPSLHVHAAAAKSSIAAAPAHTTRRISRSELATHNTPGDIWISLGDMVYDISILSTFHPGGEKTLLSRAGLDADDMFQSVHAGSYEVQSLLAPMAIGQLAAPVAAGAESEQVLSILVQAQNDLTNSSRFEQRPTGAAEQLARAPPSELVRSSLSQFCKVWTVLLEKCNPACALSELISLGMGSFGERLAARQQALYRSGFWDEERCAMGLCGIFDAHEHVVGKIHRVVDEMKRKAVEGPLSKEDWRLLFEEATLDVAAALGVTM
ncbi:Nucleoside phosphatase GDA1 CD39 [Cordyceps militaris]|uniref:Nucleoside phosphatase GDA1 CD39 n=1 Tax=Cordyceps militaris TaxID=73501 RepID=A0A2H4SS68_CORMI|nr:Nucleoside phosphatase GDA1 CD39 [Cordyceps militaris]